MGGISSKSGLSRRNSVERRSQRRTLSSTKSELQKIEKQVDKFKGKRDDDEYNQIKSKIVTVRKRLQKIAPLPNNKENHTEQFKILKDLAVLLEEKALANENTTKTDEEQNRSSAQSPIQRKDSDATDISRASSSIRKTVEIKMMQVTPVERPNSEVSVRSPEDKRKSILKMGVPVMPLAVMENQRRISNAASSNVSPAKAVQLQAPSKETEASLIENVKKEVGDIEFEISQFKGSKMDDNYVRLRDQLFKNLEMLCTISVKDDLLVQKKEQCIQYVRSCLNFLEEKAAEGINAEDDVFLQSPERNNNDVNNLSKKLTATSV